MAGDERGSVRRMTYLFFMSFATHGFLITDDWSLITESAFADLIGESMAGNSHTSRHSPPKSGESNRP